MKFERPPRTVQKGLIRMKIERPPKVVLMKIERPLRAVLEEGEPSGSDHFPYFCKFWPGPGRAGEPNLHRGVNDPFGKFYEIYRGKQVQCLSYFSPENVAKTFPAYLTPLPWRFSTALHCVKSVGGETTYMVSHPAAAAPLERLSLADQTV